MSNNFINKNVSFKFRGIDFNFDLSQGLFSSAGVDNGTKFLLKIFSQILDDDIAAGKNPPLRVLDAGCGTGVIGICAAAAIAPLVNDGGGGGLRLLIRCQDRDELARLITTHNAAINGISPALLEAYTEPLLAGLPLVERLGAWDLILTNIPAKAGTPVLADFVRRSVGLLNPGGRVIMVAVRTLADFFREQIALAAEAELLQEHQGPGHSVLVYGQAAHQKQTAAPVNGGPDFIKRHPFYVRAEITRAIEDIPIHLTTIHGASGFDNPGGAVLAAAKLARRLQFSLDGAPLLVHEPGQGFFPCWLLALKNITTEDTEGGGGLRKLSISTLEDCCPKDSCPDSLEFLRERELGTLSIAGAELRRGISQLQLRETPCLNLNAIPQTGPVVLSGRNILALEAARYNVIHSATQNVRQNVIRRDGIDGITAAVVPVADLQQGETALLQAAGGRPYGCIAAFPELLPQSSLPKMTKAHQEHDQLGAIWDAAPPLLAEGGIFLVTFSSSDAERFDRKKPAGFTRLGSVKRNGFRALAYRRR